VLINRTIVGTEQTSYTFYVPPTITISDNPLAPFPQVTKYLPPGSDKLDKRTEVGFTPQTNLPLAYLYVSSSCSFLTCLSLNPEDISEKDRRGEQFNEWVNQRMDADDRYGKGFSKLADGPRYDVYYGDQKARHVEARWYVTSFLSFFLSSLILVFFHGSCVESVADKVVRNVWPSLNLFPEHPSQHRSH